MLKGNMNKKQVRRLKKALCKVFKTKGTDSLARSLKLENRIIYDSTPYDETCYEYGFIYGDYTDEEIETWKECEWHYINSWYDCTGQWFTRYIHTHRNPNGTISFVHCMGLDI